MRRKDEEQPGRYRCCRCQKLLPVSAFAARKKAWHGHEYYCRTCAALRRKRQRWRKTLTPAQEAARKRQRSLERRAQYLARRLARADLLLDLCAQEYGLDRSVLLGPGRSGRVYEAQAVATRLIRSVCFFHPLGLAHVLECPPAEIPARLRLVGRWTHYLYGDVRISDRVRRIRAQYRDREKDLVVTAQPYETYAPVLRLPGTAHPRTEQAS